MAEVWLVLAQLLLCGLAIAVCGTSLTRYANVIADKTRWSGAWIGLVLLATVTSLPDAPDVAVGNVLGACVLNLAYVAVLDVMQREEPLFRRASQGHISLAGFGIVMLAVVALGLALAHLPMPYGIGPVGLAAPALLLVYAVAVHTVFVYERSQMVAGAERAASRYPGITLPQAALRCLAGAASWSWPAGPV